MKSASILLVGSVILLAAGLGLWIPRVTGPRIVGRAVAPDGTEICMVQRFNWLEDPFFTTSCVYRKPGGLWGWLYYDHEDDYWHRAAVSLDTNRHTATFFRKQKPAVIFNWNTETYTLVRWQRTVTGAQSWLPSGWSPDSSTP